MVHIREYYMDNEGKEQPGKKGIALTKEQWDALSQNMDRIEEALNSSE